MATIERELSFGEKAVGLTFNPSAGSEIGDHVQSIKVAAANFIDICNNLRSNTSDPEQKRMYSVAITEAQAAQMWAVKGVTWPPAAGAAAGPMGGQTVPGGVPGSGKPE